MTAQSLTLSIPDPLYDQIKRRAAARARSIEEETLDLIAAAVPAGDALPEDLAAAVSTLALLDDRALEDAVRSHFAHDSAADLEMLHLKRQRGELSEPERARMHALIRQYERAMLVHAPAAPLLRERGRAFPGPGATP
jgi:plasmid stability protein